jgi:rhodanese-related sulfurtransferase
LFNKNCGVDLSTGQVILYVLIALVLLSYVRKFLNNRKITQHNADDLNKLIKNPGKVLLLDVRTEPERKSGFIKGSVHIPLNQLRSKQQELEKYKNKEIVCYCRSGNRSVNAAVFLQKHGFNASNLKGGIVAWNYQNNK